MPETYVRAPKPVYEEGSSFSATAYFRVADVATAPTTARYRIDDLKARVALQDWTSLTAAASISIPITATDNAIRDQSNAFETKQLTVESDFGTATATRDSVRWKVRNIIGF